jgi:hypothetical protein
MNPNSRRGRLRSAIVDMLARRRSGERARPKPIARLARFKPMSGAFPISPLDSSLAAIILDALAAASIERVGDDHGTILRRNHLPRLCSLLQRQIRDL